MNTNELFETISEGLVRGESNGNFGVSEGLLNPEDIDCSEALAALATLRQQVAAMQAAIDEWHSINHESSMDEAVMACDALAKFATRNQANGS